MRLTRRSALFALPAAALAAPEPAGLARRIGLTTGSFMPHLSESAAAGKLVMLDLPAIMRDDLGLTVLYLMTACLPSLDRAYCDKLRNNAVKAGITITNLKMNQPKLDMASPDPETRRHALSVYESTIDSAAVLGCRWVRPIPGPNRPDLKLLAGSYHRLMDYGARRGIALLVENYGWMTGDPDAIPAVVKAVGRGLRCQPDTGNWEDAVRYQGLEKAFPLAVSCDFKAFDMGADGSHARYDLKRCFDAGWKAGFRGPWCFEHFHKELKPLLREMVVLRDLLRKWMSA